MPIFDFQTLENNFCLPTSTNVNIQATFEAFRDFVGIEINCLQPLRTVFPLSVYYTMRTISVEQQPVGPVKPPPPIIVSCLLSRQFNVAES